MRRHIIMVGMLALTGIFAACSTENTTPVEPAEKMITIRLSTNGAPEIVDGVDTKTMLSGMSVHWQEGDKIRLFGHSSTNWGKDLGVLTNISPDGKDAVFQGNVNENNWKQSDYLYVIYPYTETVNFPTSQTSTPKWNNVNIPQTQKLEAGTFTRGANISVGRMAKASTDPLYFKNFTGLLELKLTGSETITKIEIKTPTLAYNVGSVNLESKTLSIGYTGTGKDIVFSTIARDNTTRVLYLENEEGVQLTEEPQAFYASVVPFGKEQQVNGNTYYANQYEIIVTKADGTTVSLTTDVLTEYPTSGRIARLGTFNIE